MNREIPTAIELKLYLSEAYWLAEYFKEVAGNLYALEKHSPDQSFVLVEYYKKQFAKDLERLKRYNNYRKAYSVKIPLSVARILWKNWQGQIIHQALNNVLGGIDGCLKNLNLEPVT